MHADVRVYIIDLGSTNGTVLNGDKIEGLKFYELKHTDLIKFGESSRDYLVMDEVKALQES